MFYALFAFVLALSLFSAVHASLYVTSPDEDTIYYGGESCTVTWLDNGDKPLLSSIGVSFAGLYTGDMQLVQSIEYIDVSSSHSLTFTPLAEAGPDSDDYYIAFTSVSLKENGTSYQAYSPSFTLEDMTGSFSSAYASATASIPIPSSLLESNSSSTTVLSTSTVGTLYTSESSLTSLTATHLSSSAASHTSSGFITSAPSSTTVTPTSSGSPSATAASNTGHSRSIHAYSLLLTAGGLWLDFLTLV